ncbi:hypothetical protein SAMN04488000_104468 [Lentzea albida]|uniref:Uncharacterized protein n=1 Tax=Lentzea albida TaxID=65499 RepID=A0A1H9J5B9_9PSEU|nr:hypothetical protein SAMN04488000_104468 [Lentzea albida]
MSTPVTIDFLPRGSVATNVPGGPTTSNVSEILSFHFTDQADNNGLVGWPARIVENGVKASKAWTLAPSPRRPSDEIPAR